MFSKKIFDLVLEKLNQNSQGELFDGNFVFKFSPQPSDKVQDFHILKTNENSLEPDTQRVVPFVDVESIEIPFNEKNQRSDFEKTFYLAMRIEPTRDEYNNILFDFDYNDPRWLALMETYQLFKDTLTFDYEGARFTFKVREPQKVSVFKHNKAYYQIFAFSMNVVKVAQGHFGNEMTLSVTFDDNGTQVTEELDTISTTAIMGKLEQDNTDSKQADKTLKANQRTFEVQTTINYRGLPVDKLFLEEALAIPSDIETRYTLNMTQGMDFDITRQMVVYSSNIEFKNNAVERIALTFKRPKGA